MRVPECRQNQEQDDGLQAQPVLAPVRTSLLSTFHQLDFRAGHVGSVGVAIALHFFCAGHTEHGMFWETQKKFRHRDVNGNEPGMAGPLDWANWV